MTDKQLTHEELQEIAEQREKDNEEFYKFYEWQYYATGEGLIIYLMIDRNYGDSLETFRNFIGDEYYSNGILELQESEFMEKWKTLIPDYVKKMVALRNQPSFHWKQEIYLNYA